MRVYQAIVLLGFLLAACGQENSPNGKVIDQAANEGRIIDVTYRCEDSFDMRVRFLNATDEAEIYLPQAQEPIILPAQVTGSGFGYASPKHSLRGKGDEAMWTVGRRMPIPCKEKK